MSKFALKDARFRRLHARRSYRIQRSERLRIQRERKGEREERLTRKESRA